MRLLRTLPPATAPSTTHGWLPLPNAGFVPVAAGVWHSLGLKGRWEVEEAFFERCQEWSRWEHTTAWAERPRPDRGMAMEPLQIIECADTEVVPPRR